MKLGQLEAQLHLYSKTTQHTDNQHIEKLVVNYYDS